jgi:hypothetical protein
MQPLGDRGGNVTSCIVLVVTTIEGDTTSSDGPLGRDSRKHVRRPNPSHQRRVDRCVSTTEI